MISVNDTEARRIERNVNTRGRSGNERLHPACSMPDKLMGRLIARFPPAPALHWVPRLHHRQMPGAQKSTPGHVQRSRKNLGCNAWSHRQRFSPNACDDATMRSARNGFPPDGSSGM